jgi:hypothetical protein
MKMRKTLSGVLLMISMSAVTGASSPFRRQWIHRHHLRPQVLAEEVDGLSRARQL